MDRIDELELRVGCQELLNRYAIAVNDQDIDGFVSMFAADGVWIRPGGMEMHGHGEIRAFIASVFRPGRPVRHLNGGAAITPVDADNATARSITAVFDSDTVIDGKVLMTGPAYLAEYSDKIIRTADGWRLARRETSVMFVSAHAQPIPGISPLQPASD